MGEEALVKERRVTGRKCIHLVLVSEHSISSELS